MCDDGIDFFDFSECLSNLVESQHLTLSDDGLYAITEKGLHNGAICESSLPYSVRLRADKNITIFNQKLKRRAQIQSDIAPRRNYVIRRASNLSKESHIIAANVDRALLVVTLRAPETATEFVDRFLVTCEAYKVPVTILLSKLDLQDAEAVAEFRAVYEGAGYRVLEVSVREGRGVEEVRELLAGRTTLVSGNSGVGKSTLIQAIDPSLDIRTGEISESHHKGRHTTTFSTMYPLAGGGAVIDTPGIKGFGLIDIDEAELWHYFPEMMRVAPACRFYNCTHTHEPGCAVTEAVKAGEIAWPRYESYLKIRDEDEKYRK